MKLEWSVERKVAVKQKARKKKKAATHSCRLAGPPEVLILPFISVNEEMRIHGADVVDL